MRTSKSHHRRCAHYGWSSARSASPIPARMPGWSFVNCVSTSVNGGVLHLNDHTTLARIVPHRTCAMLCAGRLVAWSHASHVSHASSSFFLINLSQAQVLGHGGHGSMPHEIMDAIVVAAHLTIALKSVSRNLFSFDLFRAILLSLQQWGSSTAI